MRAAVEKKLLPWFSEWEGVTDYMYLDTKGYVTTGIGFLIDSIEAAQGLAWYRADGIRASDFEVATEWRRVKARTAWASLSGLASVWSRSAVLHLRRDSLESLLRAEVEEKVTGLKRSVPFFDRLPAPLQLVMVDYSYQNGAAFLTLRKDGRYVWSNTRAAVLAEDWDKAALAVPGTDDRAEARKKLFRIGAIVESGKLDPDTLWYPDVPVLEPEPAKGLIMASPEVRNLYKTGGKDQAVPAGGTGTILDLENGKNSTISGPSAGVDAQITVILNAEKDTNIWLEPVLVEVDSKDGGNAGKITARASGRRSVPRGVGIEQTVFFKGPVSRLKSGREQRLRLRIKSSEPGVLVTLTQVSGWALPE